MAKTRKLNPDVKPKYKYNINHQLGLLPKNLPISKVVEHLATHNVTKDEFYRDRSILLGSTKSIPEDRLVIYAIVFDCEVHDLRNQQVKARSIRAVMDGTLHKPDKKPIKSSLR